MSTTDAEPRGMKTWQGLLTMVVVGVGAQVAGVVTALVVMGVRAVATGEMIDPTAGSMTFDVIASALVAIGLVMALGSALAVKLAGVPVKRGLGLNGARWPTFVAAPIGILALGPTSDLLRRVMQLYLPNFTLHSLDQLDGIARSAPVWIVAPLFALVPGIAEELLFRGALQRSIRTGWLAVVLSGVFFAAYHTDPHHVLAVLPLGFYLAWLGYRTGSTLVPITAHVANNATAVVIAVLFEQEAETAGPWSSDVLATAGGGWAVAALAVAAVWWFTREPKPAPVVVLEEGAAEVTPSE